MRGLQPFGSERLVMRPMEEGDAPFVVGLRSDPENSCWFRSGAPVSLDSHLAWFRERYLNDPGREEYVVECEGRPVGVVSGQGVSDGVGAEVGYVFSREARGRGLATEAVGALVAHLAATRGARVVTAEVAPGNGPSEALLKRLGFKRCGGGGPFLSYKKELGEEGRAS